MKYWCTIILVPVLFLFLQCDSLILVEEPTKARMEGVWTIVEAYNEQEVDFLDSINFPITAFHLNSDNTVISTAGPMIQYIVYGGSNYTKIFSKIDQVFDYATLSFTSGEFFVGEGTVDHFALEIKLEGLPGQKTLDELLSLIGVQTSFLKKVIYHKFLNVQVSFSGAKSDTMIWQWDAATEARYNTKDANGDYIVWGGWPTTSFSKCSFVLVKQTKTLIELIKSRDSPRLTIFNPNADAISRQHNFSIGMSGLLTDIPPQ
ncbi:MAG: hypothetical protein JW795_06325 [Chitinivibrionales bacterium]|nr:hypothetical protein [Chitinivibrionales bacterium]